MLLLQSAATQFSTVSSRFIIILILMTMFMELSFARVHTVYVMTVK